jgi:Arc/MetJ-type ribon-helix-helix transcriptional regulator
LLRDALRLLERAEAREAYLDTRLRQAFDYGIASGEAGPPDLPALTIEARRKLAEQTEG